VGFATYAFVSLAKRDRAAAPLISGCGFSGLVIGLERFFREGEGGELEGVTLSVFFFSLFWGFQRLFHSGFERPHTVLVGGTPKKTVSPLFWS
jgi:hypothetical protein